VRTRLGGGTLRKLTEAHRQVGPGPAGFRVESIVTITFAVGDPADLPAVGHGDRHALSAGRQHVPEGRGRRDPVYAAQQRRLERQGEARQVGQPQLACALLSCLIEEVGRERQFSERSE
jgi:hypothetical protein